MTTYAEKADIAAKAVKVLDSVTMGRQAGTAKRYAKRAMKVIDSWHNTCIISVRTQGAWHLIRMVESAVSGMESRLDKPRYTLKDGEWVRKTASQKMLERFSKEFDTHRAGAALAIASRPMPTYGPHNALVGSAPYNHRGQ